MGCDNIKILEYWDIEILEYIGIGILRCWNIEILELWVIIIMKYWNFARLELQDISIKDIGMMIYWKYEIMKVGDI